MNQSIGERLRSAREARGVSLEEAALVTKVQRKILEAMEQNRVEEVLDLTYAKIFLKKYASFLRLDALSLVEEYQSLHGSVPEHPIAPASENPPKDFFFEFRKIAVPVGIGLIALIGISFMGYLAFDLYRNLKRSRAIPTTRTTMQKSRQRVKSPEKGSESFVRSSVASKQIASSSKILVPHSQPLKLTIRTKADVWVQIKSDGAVIFQNVLPKGARENWTAKEELELWTGNAGAMELSLNGNPIENPGTGVKKGIKITREGLRVPS